MASIISFRSVWRLPLCLALLGETFLAVSSASADVVISQVYGGGGGTGATYQNDFIEIYNRGPASQSLTGWSVQYADATGTSWSVTPLTSVTLQPFQYYLVKEASSGAVGALLPAADATGTINLSATAGKVALVNATVALTSSCSPPGGVTILDFVGYGATADCFEGGGSAPAGSNTTAVTRISAGCTDTDNNNNDFTAIAPNPRNSSSFNPSSTNGGNKNACFGIATAALGGNMPPSGGSGLWTIDSGGTGTFSNASSGNSNFTPTSGTSIVLKWTVSSPCGGPDASSTLAVSVFTCQNGGICVYNPTNDFANCVCPQGYSGVHCQNTLSGACCLPGGAGCQFITISQCNSLSGTWSQNQCPSPATVGGPQTICSGGTTAALGGNDPTPPSTSQWSVVSGGTGTFSPFSGFANATFTHATGSGPIILRWTNTNSVCTTHADVTVTIRTPPTASIVSNPSPATICAGGSSTFTATPGGTGPFHYDWRSGGSSLGAADQNTLTTGVAGSYDVVVSGACTPTATSNAITLTVFPGGSGDGNASGTANGDDIQGCVNALLQGSVPSATYCAYDMNADGVVDNNDIAGFVTVLLGP